MIYALEQNKDPSSASLPNVLQESNKAMAEAMIKDQYVSATLPTLPPPDVPPSDQQSDPQQESRHSGKVVEFDLPVKRHKPNTEITAHAMISDIQNSVGLKDRLDAISTARTVFDHDFETVHDEEIASGADAALCKHLAFLLLKKHHIGADDVNDNTKTDETGIESLRFDFFPDNTADQSGICEEISNTTAAIEMVLRCSANSVYSSFERIGTELLPLIMHIVKEEINLRQGQGKEKKNNDASKDGGQGGGAFSDNSVTTESSSLSVDEIKHGQSLSKKPSIFLFDDLCLKSCTKIIGHLARVGALTKPLAGTRGLLSTLKHVISVPKGMIPVEAKLNSLWVLANLACNAQNMVTMACHPGLIETLVQVAANPKHNEDDKVTDITEYLELLRSRSIALRAILNLSWAHENKIPFAEHTVLLDALLGTAQHRNSSLAGGGRGVSGILLQSRRHAAGALRNIAAAPRRTKRHLCRYKSNTFLDILADIAGNDPDDAVRDRIHATMFNLVSADTAQIYTQKKNVLDVIAKSATPSGNGTNNNEKNYIKTASRTLRTLEKAIPEDEDGYNVLKGVITNFEAALEDKEQVCSSSTPV